MRALIFLFGASLAIALAQAGDAPKQGDESSTNYYVGLPGTGEMVGIKRTDNGDVQPSGDEVVEAGSILSVPPGAIHSLHNDSGAASVTLQLYGTNLEFTQHRNYTPRRPS